MNDQRREGKGNLQGGLAANLYACALRGGANTLTAKAFPVFCLTRTLSIAMYRLSKIFHTFWVFKCSKIDTMKIPSACRKDSYLRITTNGSSK
jgi:hypothetical protein